MKLEYRAEGDYLLPNIATEPASYGKYGMARLRYIQEYDKLFYQELLTLGTLNEYLTVVDGLARIKVDNLVKDMLEQNPAPDKATHQMEWVGHMNNLKDRAEEIVYSEQIYY